MCKLLRYSSLLSKEEKDLFYKNTPYCLMHFELDDGRNAIFVINKYGFPVGIDSVSEQASSLIDNHDSPEILLALARSSRIESVVFDTPNASLGLYGESPYRTLRKLIRRRNKNCTVCVLYKGIRDFDSPLSRAKKRIANVNQVVADYYGNDGLYTINSIMSAWTKVTN